MGQTNPNLFSLRDVAVWEPFYMIASGRKYLALLSMTTQRVSSATRPHYTFHLLNPEITVPVITEP